MSWYVMDVLIILAYGFQHTVLTTRPAMYIYNKLLPDYSWNFVYSVFSVITLVIGFKLWKSSNIYLFKMVPGSLEYHVMTTLLCLSLFMFLYCFKYTTSFWQWLGVKQIGLKLLKKPLPTYYKLRNQGIKKYIRFPHHTCLIVFFWSHPAMTLDTLLLAIGATVYLYLGTYHQDKRGLRIIGSEWEAYRENTCLLIPGPKVISIMIDDIKAFLNRNDTAKGSENKMPENNVSENNISENNVSAY